MSGDKYFLDSNVFLRIIVKDDEKKVEECTRLIELIRQKKIKAFTSSTVIAEIIWVSISFYKIKKEEVVELIRALLSNTGVKVRDKVSILSALDIYEKNSVKFIDALIASDPWLIDETVKLVSYDKDFDKIGVSRVEPSQVVKKRRL